jgi:hypothetical protein
MINCPQRRAYFYKLAQLRLLVDVTGIEPALLAALLHRLRTRDQRQEIEAQSRARNKHI